MKERMIKFLTWLRIVVKSFMAIKNIHLGDKCIYDGKLYSIDNGVCYPCWTLRSLPRNPNGEKGILVHQDKFKVVLGIKTYIQRFKQTYRFYMSYWFDIMVRNFPESAWDSASNELGF